MLMLLVKDEMRHILRSRIAYYGLALPLISVAAIFHPDPALQSLGIAMGSNMGGLITGGLVATSLVSDLQNGIPVLFAVRPIPRNLPILARFLAVVTLLAGLQGLGLLTASAFSWLLGSPLPAENSLQYFSLGLSLTLLSGSLGLVLGVFSSTTLAAVLGIFFLGSNLNNGLTLGQQWLLKHGWHGWSLCTLTISVALMFTAAFVTIASARYSKLALRG
ncbi:MAG: hypothetical protein LWX11_04420 [Firmicutes bacterium]|nr:hypothetical protein [Bacillota bacterium]